MQNMCKDIKDIFSHISLKGNWLLKVQTIYCFGYDLYGSKNMATTPQRAGGKMEIHC